MKQLRKSEIREVNAKLQEAYGTDNFFNPKEKLVHDEDLLIKDDYNAFFLHEGKWVPTVKTLLKIQILKTVTVDMGAVKFVVNGADIMRPGVTECDQEIKENEIIVIIDEKNHKPLAVGISLFSGADLIEQSSGKVVKTLHYVGDRIWNPQ